MNHETGINPLSQSRHIGNQNAHATKDMGHAKKRDDIERISELLMGILHSPGS